MVFRAMLVIPLLAAFGCGTPETGPVLERLVLVTIDTLRADHVGAYGAGPDRTPTLDRLAAEGVRFEVAVSPAPLTLPSHATLLTGLDPPRHGVHHNGLFELPGGIPTVAELLRGRGYETSAFVSAFVLDARFGLARGFDHYDDRVAHSSRSEGAVSMAERTADQTVDAALAWLETAPARFFLWVHLYDPHAVHQPPEPFATRFARDRYAGEVAFADAEVGRLLAALDERFGREGTAVVLTSDHGEGHWQHGEVTHAYGLYETTQHVPLLVRAPGLPAGHVVRSPVRLADVAPTLLALSGVEPVAALDGRSLLAPIRSEPAEPEPAYLETLAPHYDMGWSPLYGVRSGRWKYIRAPRPELYDLALDPRELRDRAEAEPQRVAELDRTLERLLEGASASAPNRSVAGAERGRLEALGYIVHDAAAPATEALPLGRVGGVNPKERIHEANRWHRANRLIAVGRPDEALEELAHFPAESGWMTAQFRATAALAAGRPDVAEESARALIEAAPSLLTGFSLLASALELKGDLDGAERACQEILRRDPEAAGPWVGLGRISELRGDAETARVRYRAARERDPDQSEAAWRLAALEIEAGRFSEAESLLSDLPMAPHDREPAALRLARAELAVGRSAEALVRVDAALAREGDAASLHGMRATILHDSQRVREALAARERALALEPESALHANNLAWSLVQLGEDLPRARELAARAVAATDRDPGALDTLAAVLILEGRAAEALSLVEEALPKSNEALRPELLERREQARAALGRGSGS